MGESENELVEGLWARLRNVLIALDRLDRLESANDFVGWAETFASDNAQVETTTRAWVLRALHTASDSRNYELLFTLQKTGAQSIAQLMQVTNLSRVEVTERVKDLAQVGFVAQALESDSVQATRAADGVIALIESVREGIAQKTRRGLTQDNPPPRARRPIRLE